MSRQFARDFMFEVQRGAITGFTSVRILGLNGVVGTTRVPVVTNTSSGDVTQSTIAATPATVKVASTSANDTSAGSGLRTVTLIGLDSAGAAQSETITLTGTTAATSSGTYSAINGLRALTWGATNWNEGNVWVGSGTFTSGVPAVKFFAMSTRANRSSAAYYVVPAGKTLYLQQWSVSCKTSSRDVECYLTRSTGGAKWFTESNIGFGKGSFTRDILAIDGIASADGIVAGSHVRCEAISSAGSTNVTASLAGILVDD